MDPLMIATTVLTGVSTLLLIALLALYFTNLRKAKSRLLWGLIIFSLIFLVQDAFSLYYSITMMDYYVQAVQVHVFVFSLLQTLAFAVMLWISLE